MIMMGISCPFMYSADSINVWLIATMALYCAAFLIYTRIDLIDLYIFTFIFLLVACPLLNHPETLEWGTIIYTLLYCLSFVAYKTLLSKGYLTADKFITFLKYMIYAYAIVLIIQQFCVLLGLPIFNIMGAYRLDEPWKLNSLSGEPSWTARRMGVMMYCYIVMKELKENSKYQIKVNWAADKWVWMAFGWTMITMISGTGIVFFLIVMSRFIKLRNIIYAIVIGLILLVVLSQMSESNPVERAYKSAAALLTFDEKEILKADGSAAFRIVPVVLGAKLVDVTSIDGWFGHGVNYSYGLVRKHIPGAPKSMGIVNSWGVWLNYGFVVFMLYMLFTVRACINRHDLLYSLFFWIMLVFINGINTQLVWFGVMMLYTTKYFYNHGEEKKELY